MNQAWTAQEISASTSVELHHRAPDSAEIANSVHPLCIGFDAADDGVFESDDPADDEINLGGPAPALLP